MEANSKVKMEEEIEQEKIEQPTGQTVQSEPPEVSEEPPVSRQPYIEMAEDENGDWSWCLWAVNGRPMAVSVMPFKRRNDCQKNLTAALELFRLQNLKIVASL